MLGSDSLRRKLNKLSNLDLTNAINKSCLLVENEAKQRCPVGTGQLRSSITHKTEKNSGEVYTNVDYAP